MSFVDAVKAGYSNYANFEGRTGRAEFWWFALFLFITYLVLSVFSDFLAWVFILGSLVPGVAISIRRLHDTGHSGVWALFYLLHIIGFIVLTAVSFYRPSGTPNQYGPPAEGAESGEYAPPPSGEGMEL